MSGWNMPDDVLDVPDTEENDEALEQAELDADTLGFNDGQNGRAFDPEQVYSGLQRDYVRGYKLGMARRKRGAA